MFIVLGVLLQVHGACAAQLIRAENRALAKVEEQALEIKVDGATHRTNTSAQGYQATAHLHGLLATTKDLQGASQQLQVQGELELQVADINAIMQSVDLQDSFCKAIALSALQSDAHDTRCAFKPSAAATLVKVSDNPLKKPIFKRQFLNTIKTAEDLTVSFKMDVVNTASALEALRGMNATDFLKKVKDGVEGKGLQLPHSELAKMDIDTVTSNVTLGSANTIGSVTSNGTEPETPGSQPEAPSTDGSQPEAEAPPSGNVEASSTAAAKEETTTTLGLADGETTTTLLGEEEGDTTTTLGAEPPKAIEGAAEGGARHGAAFGILLQVLIIGCSCVDIDLV